MADGNSVFSLDVAQDRQPQRTLFRSPSHTLRDARVPETDAMLQAADAMPDISGMTLGVVPSMPLSGPGSALGSDDEAMSAMAAAVHAAKSGVRNTAHKRASRGTASPSSRPHTNSARPPMPGRRPDTDSMSEARAPTPAMYWNKRSTWGERPPQMRSQTMTVIGSNIYVFGGWNNSVCYNDVYVLDTESMFWTRMKTHGDAVPPCRAHTATAVGTRLFVFGGGDGTQYFSDLFVLDVRTCVWERARVTGVVPAPRRTHTCFHFGAHVYLFGGGDGHRALNDLWRVRTEPEADGSYVWEEVETTGGRPFPRGYHTSTLVGSQLVVFGGSDGQECFGDTSLLNLDTMEWVHVAIDPPLTRLAHSATLVGMYLFVICGHDGSDYSSQVLMLKLDTLKWETRMIYGAAPIPRGYHACALHDGRLILHGGYNGQEVFDDLYTLELSSYSYLPQVPEFVIGCHR
ncbi:hypothetical protein GGH12_003682 [Coemansia sp. RSA 1822]|nr:hypothetical protein LPJ76_003352 [Coemansia sp. RSA 638]KAJ2543759.1 hypothetical protein GGF49_001841 [Coemansia sp. RSA 1853]KAJ2561827.1 hypothetical protein GGH12_003682 [Coemansia sp. RSA 1822]